MKTKSIKIPYALFSTLDPGVVFLPKLEKDLYMKTSQIDSYNCTRLRDGALGSCDKNDKVDVINGEFVQNE